MKVGCIKEHNPAHVRLHHRVLAMKYPDAGLPPGLLEEKSPMLKEVGTVGVIVSTLTRDPAIAEWRRHLSA